MISNLRYILRHVLVVVALLVCIDADAQNVAPMTITAKSDSTTLIMGDRTSVNVEVLKNSHSGALLSNPEKGADYYGLEMIDVAVDSVDLGNDRVQINYRYTFQSFDPAEILTLPPFVYASQGDTVVSDIITFKVLPVELSPELGDPNDVENLKIHPDESVLSIKSKWYDFIPDYAIWIVLALAFVMLCVTLYMLYKKNGPKIFVPRKPIPPYELAITALRKLKGKRLIEGGLAKQFYTEVTDIWRKYLDGRFGISALEMTSRQILKQLRSNKETHLTAKEMEQILEISDFVKFAGMSPSREEMVKAYDTIYDFVEKTKPEPEPEEADKDKKPETLDGQPPKVS